MSKKMITQKDKFEALARKAECKDDEKAFDEKLKKIARPQQKSAEKGMSDNEFEKFERNLPRKYRDKDA